MFKVICVSARNHSNNFLQSIEMIAKSGVEAIILREKDLSEDEYFILAKSVKEICDKTGAKIVISRKLEALNT